MAKKNRKKEKAIQPQIASSESARWSPWQLKGLGVVCILLVLAIQYAPMVFEGLSPTGTDVIGGLGKTHQVNEFKKETGEQALWNPYLFSGMPLYHRLSPDEIAIDSLIHNFSGTSGRNGFIYYVIGALGMYFLMLYWGVPLWGALLASLSFALMPHFEVLLQAGHYQKFRPIMLMPWVLFSFVYLLKKGNLLGTLFFMLTFSLQVRTKHYQIVFYTLLILLFLGTAWIIGIIRERRWREGWLRSGLLAAAFVMALIMSLNPLLSVREYTPYSIRGGTGETGSNGLDFDYATGWSFAPKEMLSLLIPNAYGGANVVTYHGKAVPQLRGRKIPGYWGDMPSTEGGEYVGVLTFILAVVGILSAFRQKRGDWIALAVFIPVAVLMSFGRHFPGLYNLFFEHVPFFNKFRVPSMVLVTLYFSTALFAGLGLKALFSRETRPLWMNKWILGLGVFLILLSLSPFLFRNIFTFERMGEAGQYGAQGMEMIRSARYDLFRSDAVRLFIYAVLGCGTILLYTKSVIPRNAMAVAVGLLILVDFITVDKRFLNNLGSVSAMESSQFRETATDKFLNADRSLYRVYSLQQDIFQTNQWSYYHQSIGGYSPAKLRIYQDIIENCIYGWRQEQLPINWNILDMLDAKYIVVPGRLDNSRLAIVFQDDRRGELTYLNKTNLGRAWFVGTTEVIPDRQARLDRLNDPSFHPDSSAILEHALNESIQMPGEHSVKVTLFEPNRLSLQVKTDVQSLLVLSEIYYPEGWTATVDGKPADIHKTNHILRSVVIPAGSHELQLVFAPESYTIAAPVSAVANGLVLLALAGLAVLQVIKWRKGH